MLRRISFSLGICIYFIFANLAEAQQCEPEGTILASYRNINAYSNCGSGNIGTTTYQCVEYVKRFYSDYITYDIPWGGNASGYFSSSQNYDQFVFFANGGTVKPAPDMVLCYSEGYNDWGHVGIIQSVDFENGIITIIDQNRTCNPEEIPLPISMTVSKLFLLKV